MLQQCLVGGVTFVTPMEYLIGQHLLYATYLGSKTNYHVVCSGVPPIDLIVNVNVPASVPRSKDQGSCLCESTSTMRWVCRYAPLRFDTRSNACLLQRAECQLFGCFHGIDLLALRQTGRNSAS